MIFNVRTAQTSDIEALSIVFIDYLQFYEQQASVHHVRKFLSDRIKHDESKIFVAVSQNEMLGFVQLYPIFSSIRMKKLWLLNDLFVKPAYRKQGISLRLIYRAKKLALDTQSSGLILETAKSNEIGNALYPRAEFTLDTEHNY